jgi:hypothetical protein
MIPTSSPFGCIAPRLEKAIAVPEGARDENDSEVVRRVEDRPGHESLRRVSSYAKLSECWQYVYLVG